MAQLRRDHSKFEEAGTTVVVVGPESPEAFASYWRKNDLPFIGLPDPKHSVLKLYGQEIKLFKCGPDAGPGAWWTRRAWPASSTTATT